MTLTADIQFKDGKMIPVDPSMRDLMIKQFREWEGKYGFMVVYKGQRSRTLKQNKFFHGPLIDAFVRFTGEPDRDYWKSYLKAMFLTRFTDSGKQYTGSTAALAVGEFSEFLTNCVNFLISQGGSLDEHEGVEYLGAITNDEKSEK